MATNAALFESSQTSHTNADAVVLMWADPTVQSNTENTHTLQSFANMYDGIYTFQTTDACENAIRQLPASNRIHLIVSGAFSRSLLPRIHELPQLSTVYIFCLEQQRYLIWAEPFTKVKSIIVDTDRLISIIQSDREQQIATQQLAQMNVSGIQGVDVENSSTTAFRYNLEYLVNAGEFQYADKSMKEVATEIVTRFKSGANRDISVLVSECAQPIMYLLKREQDLADFSGPLRRAVQKEKEMPLVSLRLLIDKIMTDSNRFLGRRLITLLSKRNPVPFFQPRLNVANSEYRSVPYITHVWEYHRPVLLSFSISGCEGSTALINTLFHSNFEPSVKDEYFSGTVDVDFGCHIAEKRPLNIAHAHGQISDETLNRISTSFDGFIMHLECKQFCSSQSNVMKYLQLLPSQDPIRLLIHEMDDDTADQVQSAISIIESKYPHCKIHSLPRVNHQNNDEYRERINEVRESIFRKGDSRHICDENSRRENLMRLLDDTQRQTIAHDTRFISSIRPVLIDGREEHYPLYSLFTHLCKLRLRANKTDSGKQDSQEKNLYSLTRDLFTANAQFKERQRMGPHAYGAGFESFISLLRDQGSRLVKLNLVSMELKRQAMGKKIYQDESPYHEHLSIEIHWRNAMIGFRGLADIDRTLMVQAYRDYVVEGNPFEIVDGDNFEMQSEFLTKVFELFPSKKVFVISVVGPQNSGKSTLLNFLFGTLFEARSGRCTKGVYGTLINVQNKVNKGTLTPREYDYILVIDTEGILSIQRRDEQYDKQLILFCLAVSHLMIVNVEREIDESVRKFFTVCTQALKYLGETRVCRPTVHFVLNKRPEHDKDYCRTLLECVRETLQENKLDREVDLQSENFHILKTAYNRKPLEILDGKCAAFSTDINFVIDVQKLCQFIISTSSDIIRRTGDRFCLPTSWVDFADRVLRTIKKHPDLTHFQELFERDQYQKIRNAIRSDFEQSLSPTYAEHLIKTSERHDTDQIKNDFKAARIQMMNVLEDKMKDYCDKCQATENIRKRSLDWLSVQMHSIFQSLETSARMNSRRHNIDQLKNDIDSKLCVKALSVTHQNCPKDASSARQMFQDELRAITNEFESSFAFEDLRRQSVEIIFHLCEIFSQDILASEIDLTIHLPFLKALDNAADQAIEMDACLSSIQEKFQAEASNTNPLTWNPAETSSTILKSELQQDFKFLEKAEILNRFFHTNSTGQKTREEIKRGARQMSSQLFHDNWKTFFHISRCFDILFTELRALFSSTNTHTSSVHEIDLIKRLIEKVNNMIQVCNQELGLFDCYLSKQFCSTLYGCAMIVTVMHYYNRQKTHLIYVLKSARENACQSIERFIPWVVFVENDDKNAATNCVNELTQMLYQLAEQKIQQTMDEQVSVLAFDRCAIIKELDDMVFQATDDWLQRYVLNPIDLILERFDKKMEKAKVEIDARLKIIISSLSIQMDEIFHLIGGVNGIAQEQGAHSPSFVDNLFTLKDEQMTKYPNDKQLCIAKLMHCYLAGEDVPKEVGNRPDAVYTVDSRWKVITDKCPTPSEEMKHIFSLLRNVFTMSGISYLGIFLDTILSLQNESKSNMSSYITSSAERTYQTIIEQLRDRMRGCQERCPCCKRICDVDHFLNRTSLIGQGENQHRCQLGHQIRGMGGIHYEGTGEASLSRCEFIEDDDPVITESNTRRSWKDFKAANTTWNFGDRLDAREAFNASCIHIWERIGEQLCRHFGNGMKFVRENTPRVKCHFIFVLDHSGSMNENVPTQSIRQWFGLVQADQSTNKIALSPWEYLLRAIKGFLDIRKRQVSWNDQITMIIFADQAKRIYHREKVKDIVLDQLNTAMSVCGYGTNYSLAFQSVVEVLKEAKNNPDARYLRQTIIFMTDGKPEGSFQSELQKLCNYRTEDAASSNNHASIHSFWTMALGNFDKKTINKINATMQGKLVNIEQPEDLEEAYAQIAEVL